MNSTVFGFIIFRDKEENSFMFLKQKRKVKENTELRQMSMVGVRYILHQGRTQRTDIGVRRGTYV